MKLLKEKKAHSHAFRQFCPPSNYTCVDIQKAIKSTNEVIQYKYWKIYTSQ